MPLAEHVGVPAALAEHLGHRGALERDVAVRRSGSRSSPRRCRPCRWSCGCAPSAGDERVGEHSAVVCQFVYVSPARRSRLMFGVSISPPHGSIAEKPVSSSTMYSTFGAPSGATGCTNGSQSGTESRSSRLIVPLKRLLMRSPFRSDRRCNARPSRRADALHHPNWVNPVLHADDDQAKGGRVDRPPGGGPRTAGRAVRGRCGRRRCRRRGDRDRPEHPGRCRSARRGRQLPPGRGELRGRLRQHRPRRCPSTRGAGHEHPRCPHQRDRRARGRPDACGRTSDRRGGRHGSQRRVGAIGCRRADRPGAGRRDRRARGLRSHRPSCRGAASRVRSAAARRPHARAVRRRLASSASSSPSSWPPRTSSACTCLSRRRPGT